MVKLLENQTAPESAARGPDRRQLRRSLGSSSVSSKICLEPESFSAMNCALGWLDLGASRVSLNRLSVLCRCSGVTSSPRSTMGQRVVCRFDGGDVGESSLVT